jgi:glyceraldehyde-3-phosphate dehydrogenase (NADP+)
MNAIPEEFQIKTLLNQDTYLVNGEKNGKVKHQQCSQRFHQEKNTNQQYWALSIYGRKRRPEAADAADAAFNNGQEYGP